MGDTPGGWQSESDSERGSVAVDAIDASASIEPTGLGRAALDADGVRAAGGCHDDGTHDNGDGSGLEAADDEGMGHGLGVRLGPSQINGVGVGVATGTGTGASAAAGVCTCCRLCMTHIIRAVRWLTVALSKTPRFLTPSM